MDYFPWCHDQSDTSLAWVTDDPEELGDNTWRLNQGKPCIEWFPAGLVFDYSKRHGLKPPDSVPNSLGIILVSKKMRRVLERSASNARIEFLPVSLRDHKKKPLKEEYFVANVLDVVPCTNLKKSDFTRGAIDKDQVDRFCRLVLDEGKIPKGKKLFRLGEKTRLILAHVDVAQAIVDADCRGVAFVELDEYGSEFR